MDDKNIELAKTIAFKKYLFSKITESLICEYTKVGKECARSALIIVMTDERIKECGLYAYLTVIEVCDSIAKQYGIELYKGGKNER